MFLFESIQTFSVSNVPPSTTRHTMHWGTALPLTCCSNKAEGHSSCQRCSQRLARRTNGGLFSVWPPPCCPARPHSTRGGQRRCVCRCLVRWHGKALRCGFFSFKTNPPPHPTPNKQTSMPNFGNSGALMRHSSEICQQLGSWLAVWEIFWHPHRPAALCKVVACLPGPALGSANPPCVSQIPSVFVRQQRGHLLMTFHVFTGVLLRVGWGVGVGGGKVGK